jgi:hypothetical protein
MSMADVTQILSALEQGDPRAAERLLPLVYDELRRLAAAKLARESPDHSPRPRPTGTGPTRGHGSIKRSFPAGRAATKAPRHKKAIAAVEKWGPEFRIGGWRPAKNGNGSVAPAAEPGLCG